MNSFRFVKNGTWGEYLLVDSNRLDETVEFIRKYDVKNIELNFYQGYELKEISFLDQIRDVVEGLNVIQGDIDLRGIEQLKNLRRINISDELGCFIDFSAFKNLEKCSVLWNKKMKNLSSCSKLRELIVKKGDGKDLVELCKGLPNLQLITLIQARLIDLNFLNWLTDLKELEIYYSPNIEDIQGLLNANETIIKFILDHCKKVSDYGVISSLSRLEYLGINDAGKIPTLSFIKNLKYLKHLSFVGTDILDNDMSFCVGINHVGHDNKVISCKKIND